MKRTLLGLVLLAAGCGGTTYQGVIRDDVTQEPIPGARVAIGEETAEADELGFYQMEVSDDDMPHTVRVAAPGYFPVTENVLVAGDEDWAVLSYELRPLEAPAPAALSETAPEGATSLPAGTERTSGPGTAPPAPPPTETPR